MAEHEPPTNQGHRNQDAHQQQRALLHVQSPKQRAALSRSDSSMIYAPSPRSLLQKTSRVPDVLDEILLVELTCFQFILVEWKDTEDIIRSFLCMCIIQSSSNNIRRKINKIIWSNWKETSLVEPFDILKRFKTIVMHGDRSKNMSRLLTRHWNQTLSTWREERCDPSFPSQRRILTGSIIMIAFMRSFGRVIEETICPACSPLKNPREW